MAALHLLRMVAAGVAAEAQYARSVLELFLLVARSKARGPSIKDGQKLLSVALDLGVTTDGRSHEEIALDVGEKALHLLTQQEGELAYIAKAPLKRQALWREQGVVPRSIEREVAEALGHTVMEAHWDYRKLILQAVRTALAGGWGSSILATELQDVMFGTPAPALSEIGLGVLKEEEVNIIVQGDNGQLYEMLNGAAKDEELAHYAWSKGAKGINLIGMGSVPGQILSRYNIPIAGDFLEQELAVTTGAVEAIVMGSEFMMPGLADVARHYHTQIITIDPATRMEGAIHIQLNCENAKLVARQIVKQAIDNFPNRSGQVSIPPYKANFVTGFSYETLNYIQGGLYVASFRVLNDNIVNGRIRGVALVFGADNPRVAQDAEIRMTKELIKNDVLVLQSGGPAIACAKAGLMLPEAAPEFSGPGLASVCEMLGIPPVLHLGSCAEISRALIVMSAMVKEGGLGGDLEELPLAAAAPQWMAERDLEMGQCLVASGIYTVFGGMRPTLGSKELISQLFRDLQDIYGAEWTFEADPVKAAQLMIEHIDKKREALGINRARERILYDMQMRREMGSLQG